MDWRGAVRLWADGLTSVVMPRLCEVCGAPLVSGEEIICLDCDFNMPRCHIHRDQFNTIHQRLAGPALVEKAAGYFYYYRDNPYTRLIHVAKYNGRPKVARELACRFARELSADGFFDSIDDIVAVPVHWFKRLRRGYNQTDYIAEGLSEVTGLPVIKCLRSRAHATQTRRGAYNRWLNARDIYYAVNTSDLDGRHILLVDDVITSGATMLACCNAIHDAAPTARISVLALGVTEMA